MTKYNIWNNMKLQIKDRIILVKNGIFFETYNDHALILNNELGLPIIQRHNIQTGIPAKSIDKYELLLISKGYKVLKVLPSRYTRNGHGI